MPREFSKEFLEHQFKPGESGNPKGRVPGRCSAKALLEAIGDEKPEQGDAKTRLEAVIRKVYKDAEKGSPQLVHELLARVLPATTSHEVTFPDAAEESEILARMDVLARQGKTNGSGEGAEPAGANGSSGADA